MNKIKTQSNDLIIIEIPENVINWQSLDIVLDWLKHKILGKLSELKDKDLEEFVEFIPHRESDYNLYRNYLKLAKNYILGSAKQSFTSLLQSNGIETENKDYLIVEVL